MMKHLEKLRLVDNLGGGYGQKQRCHAYAYEEYKTYGKFQEEEEYCFGGRHQQQLMLQGDRRRLPLRHGPAYKDHEEEEEEEDFFGKQHLHLMQQRTSSPPLKFRPPVTEEEEEEEEEEDYRARLRQYLMQHRGAKVRQQPPPQYRPPVVDEESEEEEEESEEEEEEYYRYYHNRGRPSNFKLAPAPMAPPKNNEANKNLNYWATSLVCESYSSLSFVNSQKLTDGWRGGRREESEREMHYEGRFVAPNIVTRMVFVKPSHGQSGGNAAVKSPEKKWREPAAAAVGNWRVQHSGYMEAKWVRKGL